MITKMLEVAVGNNAKKQLDYEVNMIKQYVEIRTAEKMNDSISSNDNHNFEQQYQIREALIAGYVEMAQLNLTISKEFHHLECEANLPVEQLYSGG